MSREIFGDGKPVTWWRLGWRRLQQAFLIPKIPPARTNLIKPEQGEA